MSQISTDTNPETILPSEAISSEQGVKITKLRQNSYLMVAISWSVALLE